jgi:CheY-like chemotaxis protein
MPIMNGYDACKQIREAENSKNLGIHALLHVDLQSRELNHSQNTHNLGGDASKKNSPLIVALTAYLNQDIIEKCKVAGFDDWIETPLTKDKIQEQLINKIAAMRGLLKKEEFEYQNESAECMELC